MPVITQNYYGNTISDARDLIYGSSTADLIDGLGGRDAIDAKGGDDVVIGNWGNDVLKGDEGNDRFFFGANHGKDHVLDFKRDAVGDNNDQVAVGTTIDSYSVAYIRGLDAIRIKTTDLDFLGTGITKTGTILLTGVSLATWNAWGGSLGSNFTADMGPATSPLIDFQAPPPSLEPPLAVRTERVSVTSDGTEGDSGSFDPTVSADGRYVVYLSYATNLVPGDTNGVPDLFVFDREARITERVSVASDDTQANDLSDGADLSADGRYVVYTSIASNLVPGDTNNASDVFLYDRQTATIERVSVAGDGIQGNDGSFAPKISADGRYVAYLSNASNLVPGDTNGFADIFVFDRETRTTERLPVAGDGAEPNGGTGFPALSADGRYVVFSSYASNLVPGDTNDNTDIFVFDRETRTTDRVSVASGDVQSGGRDFIGSASISADGRYVAYASDASDLVPGDTNGNPFEISADIFVFDRVTRTTERVSVASDGTQANNHSFGPQISADGRYVAFSSAASNLVPDDTNGFPDVFVFDRESHITQRVSVASDGTQVIGYSFEPSISADGQYVAFQSGASDLVPGDTNDNYDIFVVRIDEFVI